MSHQSYPCSICGKGCNQASRCKELGIPPDGFYKPSSGTHQHDEDCEDNNEQLIMKLEQLTYKYTTILYSIIKSRILVSP